MAHALRRKLRTILNCVLVVSLVNRECRLATALDPDYEIVHQWTFMDFDFMSVEDRVAAMASGMFIPANCTLAGIKVHRGQIFVTVPRWARGVPSTLNRVDPDKSLLVPWPSWEMQTVGDCDKLQFVQSMEIDPVEGNMWVVDTGVAADLPYARPCPAKLVVFNVASGQVVRRHDFPASVVPPTNFLNDIVLDFQDPDNDFAYVSDVFVPGIVVYDVTYDRSWRAYHPSMENELGAEVVEIRRNPIVLAEPNIDGMALAPQKRARSRRLYYSALAGYNLYSIDASILHDEVTATDPMAVSAVVRLEGRKPSQSDGMLMSSDGFLYFGLLEQCAVARWNSSTSYDEGVGAEDMAANVETVVAGGEDFEWPDTLSIDSGYLYVTTNRLNRFFAGTLDVSGSEVNFRIIRTYVGEGSYLEN